MKRLVASLLLCTSLISQTHAGNRYYDNSDWRDLPCVEMMATMMRIMNDIMGLDNDNYFPGYYNLPYSPAYFPPAGLNSFYGYGNLPMSPDAISPGAMQTPSFPDVPNRLPDSFQTGQNATDETKGSFWDPNSKPQKHNPLTRKTSVSVASLNGIWEALSGDVIAIYKNDHFIWSDGKSRNLAGRLAIKGKILYAYIPARNVTLQFQFYLEPGQFIVQDKSSRVYTFKRLH